MSLHIGQRAFSVLTGSHAIEAGAQPSPAGPALGAPAQGMLEYSRRSAFGSCWPPDGPGLLKQTPLL
jgi:hypothetical protein